MSAPKIPERPMEYPYTHAARLTSFPWRMHLNHANWRWKWGLIGYVASAPFFFWLHGAINGPGNQEKYRQLKHKLHQEHEEHLKHLI